MRTCLSAVLVRASLAAVAILALAGCGSDDSGDLGTGPPAVTTGTISVSAETTGSDTDSDGYVVLVDGADGRRIAAVDTRITASGSQRLFKSEFLDL